MAKLCFHVSDLGPYGPCDVGALVSIGWPTVTNPGYSSYSVVSYIKQSNMQNQEIEDCKLLQVQGKVLIVKAKCF